ncbi:uncharacterized protein TNCV_1022491 [Trichonephila clavipes]|nr:uncharacterized protein TNCV_1022491 [Trichonephila clavipes]
MKQKQTKNKHSGFYSARSDQWTMDMQNRLKSTLEGKISRIETFIESANEETDSVEIKVQLRSLIQLQKNVEELRNNYYALPNMKDAELSAVNEDLHLLEVRLESLECLGIRDDPVLHERDQSIEIFKETVEFEKGRYIVQLPFRKSYNELSDNYPLDKQRFQNLWKRFGHDSELYQHYREIIRDYTEQGTIEEVKAKITDNRLKRPAYYLPHQAVYRFNRVNFGVSSSPFLLAATNRHNIEKYKHEFPHTVELLDRNFYLDDLISGGNEFEEAVQTSRRAKILWKLLEWISKNGLLTMLI